MKCILTKVWILSGVDGVEVIQNEWDKMSNREKTHFRVFFKKKCKQVCNLLCSVRSGDQVLSVCLILPYLVSLLQWLSCEEIACNEGDAGSIPGWGRSPRGGSHGQRSLVGYGPQGPAESDVIEATAAEALLCLVILQGS